jgi:uncharacterized repeat protein (TIGR01451 family)
MPSEDAAALVEETGDAIANDQFDLAEQKLDAASTIYDSLTRKEAADARRIRAARDSGSPPLGTMEQLDAYLRQLNSTRLLRVSFLTGTAAYLLDPLAEDAAKVTTLASDLVESERDAAAMVGDARDAATTVDLPAIPTITEAETSDTSVLVGQSVTLSVTVRNVGDDTSTDVSVAVDAEEGLDPVADSLTVADLPPDGEATRDVEIRTTESGESSLRLGLGPEEPPDNPTAVLSVADRTGVADDMLTSITTLEERLSNANLDQQTRESLQSRLDVARARAENFKQLAENDQTTAAKEAAEEANVALGDFLNALAGLSEGTLTSAQRRTFDQLATNGIEQTGLLQSEPSELAPYTDDSGIIAESGLREAVDDWVGREIDTTLLRDAIEAWRTETVVTNT